MYYAEGAEGIEPILWRPCQDFKITGTEGLDCHAMDINFDADPLHAAIIGPEWDNTDPKKPRMAFRRMYRHHKEYSVSMMLVVDPQTDEFILGLTTNRSKNPSCIASTGSYNIPNILFDGIRFILDRPTSPEGFSVFSMYKMSHNKAIKVFENKHNYPWSIFGGFHAGFSFLGRSPDISVWQLNEATKEAVKISPPSTPDGYKGGIPIPTRDALFLSRNIVARARGVFRWDAGSGVIPFLVDKDPAHKAYLSFATDGNDMVWTEGTASLPDDPSYDNIYYPFPQRDIMTAKYQIAPFPKGKRLRSDLSEENAPFAVGCGMAAHVANSVESTLQIVRLSDGVSWTIKGDDASKNPIDRWGWFNLIGLTCEEIFFGATGPPTELGVRRGTIVKVKLASLGPGLPPD